MSMGQDGKPLNIPQPGQQRPQQGHPMGDSGLRHRGAVAVGPGGISGQGQGQGQGPMGSLPHGPGLSPRGPQLVVPQNQSHNQYHHPPQPTERHWYDKIVDVIVGDEGPESKYALICSKCYVHNGLVLPQEIDDIRKTFIRYSSFYVYCLANV